MKIFGGWCLRYVVGDNARIILINIGEIRRGLLATNEGSETNQLQNLTHLFSLNKQRLVAQTTREGSGADIRSNHSVKLLEYILAWLSNNRSLR